MKTRSLFIGAALAAIAAGASAQSSVTVFGVVDLGLRRVDNGSTGKLNTMSTNGVTSSRLGFRGEEDLGGGLVAGFWLEHGLLPDAGVLADSARFFGRRATVALKSSTFGELRLGRDFTPTYNALSMVDPFGDVGVGAVSGVAGTVGSGAKTFTRSDNSAAYFLPAAVPGLSGSVMLAAGEGSTAAKYAGGNAAYALGPVKVMAAYGETTITTDKFKQAVLSASYDLKVVKLLAGVIQGRYVTNKQTTYQLGLTAPLGQGSLRAGYTRGDMAGPTVAGANVASADDATKLAVGYVYDLSKRTAVYGTLAQIKNSGASRLSISGGPAAGIGLAGTSRGIEAGLRHAF